MACLTLSHVSHVSHLYLNSFIVIVDLRTDLVPQNRVSFTPYLSKSHLSEQTPASTLRAKHGMDKSDEWTKKGVIWLN